MENKKIRIFSIMLIIIMTFSSLIGCIENKNPISKEEIIGSWSYKDIQNKVLTWIFFEDDTVLSNFSAPGGKYIDTWYNYEIKKSELCFTEINTNNSDEYCYDYDYIEDENKIKIILDDETVYFKRN